MNADELTILRKPEVQEYIQKFSKQWEDDDLCACKERTSRVETYRVHSHGCSCEPNWIPDCISRDSERPERGIVGMLAGMDKIVRLHINNRGTCVEITWTSAELIYREYAETPRLALLKALEWQIGREK